MKYDNDRGYIGTAGLQKILTEDWRLDKCSEMLFNSEDVFYVTHHSRGILMLLCDRCASTIGSPC